MSKFWYFCDSIDDTFLKLLKVPLILLIGSIVNGIADTFMNKKSR